MNPPTQTENVGWDDSRIDFHIVSGSLPQVPGATQEVVNLVRLAGVQFERSEGKLQPSRMGVMRVQVYDHQYNVGMIFGMLAVTEKLFIIYRMKA